MNTFNNYRRNKGTSPSIYQFKTLKSLPGLDLHLDPGGSEMTDRK